MNAKHDILIMTGNKLRHQYFALHLLKGLPDSALLIEKQPTESWGSHAKSPSKIIQDHFDAFHNEEVRFFKQIISDNVNFIKSKTILEIEDGAINDEAVVDEIRVINPKIIVVLSTSLLKDHFINIFHRRIINIHAGLSPYYRGSGTNVFPFYNNELEYVGMTIHYMDVGIDSGDIILQGRPVFESGDNTHTIGCKNIILGADLMTKVVQSYLRLGPPCGVKQNLSIGRVYYKKDFTDTVILKINDNLKNGIVENYIKVQPKPIDIVGEIRYE